MKKVMAILFFSFCLIANAQEKKERANKMQDYIPEEMAQVQTKQMTLDLDLTETQQKQVQQINLKNAQERKAKYEAKEKASKNSDKEKPSKDERLKMKNEHLDRQIEMKKKMKNILNEDQYKKWEEITKDKREKQKAQMHQKKKMHHSENK
ncbi:hypothetical protein [Formosa maritima]|uniref:DUF4890 domain-containing protein n=1 Tax=Formosa maritima TaxID=2592046 RepID=A0A5D0GLI6_9FLAO|nr:hypothetical protein [Formosa maritima]TYA59701.1 hypothetical protein FVF61_01210 [Formosa maritima]